MTNKLTASEFRNLLDLNDIKVPKKLDRDGLWRLCLEHKLVDRFFEDEKRMSVVKCSLIKGMTLNPEEQALLFEKIESYVVVVSRLLRRASLILHCHLLRIYEIDPNSVPNFYQMTSSDTYWKRWLTIGLKKTNPFPDEHSETTYNMYSDKFKDVNLAKDLSKLKYFDQILNYAGHTFYASLENNAWYPLFNKLQRLLRYKLNEWKIDSKVFSKSSFMHEIRSPMEKMAENLDPRVRTFVMDVKRRLNALDMKDFISDKHAKDNMTYTEAFKFNMFMQTEFAASEKKMNIMVPTFNVKRNHIRLDTKTMTFLFLENFPEHESVKRYIEQRGQYDGFIKSDATAKGSKAPHKKMLPPKVENKKKKNCTEEQWKSYKDDLELYKQTLKEVKSDEVFQKREAEHQKQTNNQIRMIQSFFKPLTKGSKWKFDGSVQTDGVSLSRQFSYTVTVERKPKKVKEELQKVKQYDKDLSCFITSINTLIVGLDPGRTNLAALSYYVVNDDNTVSKQHWSLARKQYYAESGINKRNKLKAYRYYDIMKKWSELGTLRTTVQSDIIGYVDHYNEIKETWWNLALNKIESVDALNTYSGKKRVIDRFFVKVKKDLKKKHPNTNIVIAYGSAHRSMTSSGYGEVSAPISGTFKSCQKIFNTIVENEDYTSKMDWDSGQECRKVYKKFRVEEGKVLETFGNCNVNKRAPKVNSSGQIHLVKEYNSKHQRKRRKPPDSTEEKPSDVHYPEVRGFRKSYLC